MDYSLFFAFGYIHTTELWTMTPISKHYSQRAVVWLESKDEAHVLNMNLILFSFHNTFTTWRKEKSIPGRKDLVTPVP